MTQPATGISGLSHIAIAVPDLAAAAQAVKAKFGLTAGPIHENKAQGVRLCYIELGNARIELIAPLGPASPIARFLEKNPAGGLHHLAFSVTGLDQVLSAAIDAGARQAGTTGQNVHGDRIAFLSPRDLLGTLVELEEQAP
jgi:methylmalonyl-CoA/ethylmalonyl-CoA epimerase